MRGQHRGFWRPDYLAAFIPHAVKSATLVRKLNTGALIPMYAVPGMDISKDLVKLLNQSVQDD